MNKLYAPAIATAVEALLNGYLRSAADSAARLEALAGKTIAVTAEGLDITLYFLPGRGGVRVRDQHPQQQPADVQIRATPWRLVRLAQGDRQAGGVAIRGDGQTAADFQALLQAVDIDWEEQLSHFIGDVATHRLGKGVRATRAWANTTLDTLLQNIQEYLQHERCDLPPRHALERFLDEVDRLRADTDRLAARIERLRRTLDAR